MTTRPPQDVDWRRRLAPLQLHAEPLDVQLARHRAVRWALTGLTSAIAGFFAILFAVFEHPILGFVLASLFAVPILALAWWDHLRLVRTVTAYQNEHSAPDSPE